MNKISAEATEINEDMLKALKSIVGIEAWITDREMREVFQNAVYPAIEKATRIK